MGEKLGFDVSVKLVNCNAVILRDNVSVTRLDEVHADDAEPLGDSNMLWTPCSPEDPEAIVKHMLDIPPGELLEPTVGMADLEAELECCLPSVRDEELRRYEAWQRDHTL